MIYNSLVVINKLYNIKGDWEFMWETLNPWIRSRYHEKNYNKGPIDFAYSTSTASDIQKK